MSRSPTKAYELASLRKAVTAYLDALEEELGMGTHERHLRRLLVLCKVLLEKLVRASGGTLETQAFERRLLQLGAVVARQTEAGQSSRPSSPPNLRVVH